MLSAQNNNIQTNGDNTGYNTTANTQTNNALSTDYNSGYAYNDASTGYNTGYSYNNTSAGYNTGYTYNDASTTYSQYNYGNTNNDFTTYSSFPYWGINFLIPLYFSWETDTMIGHAFSGPGPDYVGSLAFLTKQDYYSGGYRSLSSSEVQQIAADWIGAYNNFTVNSYTTVSVAGCRRVRINATRIMDSGTLEYYRIAAFYDDINNKTRVIRMCWDSSDPAYPFDNIFDTLLQNASR